MNNTFEIDPDQSESNNPFDSSSHLSNHQPRSLQDQLTRNYEELLGLMRVKEQFDTSIMQSWIEGFLLPHENEAAVQRAVLLSRLLIVSLKKDRVVGLFLYPFDEAMERIAGKRQKKHKKRVSEKGSMKVEAQFRLYQQILWELTWYSDTVYDDALELPENLQILRHWSQELSKMTRNPAMRQLRNRLARRLILTLQSSKIAYPFNLRFDEVVSLRDRYGDGLLKELTPMVSWSSP